MDTSHDISVLNTLTATTLDSVKGYREAAENSDDAQHRQFFSEMAEERSRMAADLQQHVRAIGGDPEMESSTAGAAHRGWVDLKSKFETAMQDDELSSTARGRLEQCFASVRKGHDRASAMKHAMV